MSGISVRESILLIFMMYPYIYKMVQGWSSKTDRYRIKWHHRPRIIYIPIQVNR